MHAGKQKANAKGRKDERPIQVQRQKAGRPLIQSHPSGIVYYVQNKGELY
jgi:hypothetical protein